MLYEDMLWEWDFAWDLQAIWCSVLYVANVANASETAFDGQAAVTINAKRKLC